MSAPYFIGMMSGTSLDGVDAVLARHTGNEAFETVSMVSRDIDAALRDQLLALQVSGPDEIIRAGVASVALSRLYASTVRDLLESTATHRHAPGLTLADIGAIGAHGQTIRHRPELGFTVQLLNGAQLAVETGIPVVCDFRSADIAAGGQGAPLAPGFHDTVFRTADARRAIVNIGGIANVTLLTPGQPVRGFDCGPGNVLMDAWIHRHHRQGYDVDGRWAASGQVQARLLAHWLREPYFSLPAPKSTGRDLFDVDWLDRQLASFGSPVGAGDVQATLAALTIEPIRQACAAERVGEVFVCGGGARNAHLMGRLATALPGVHVATTQALGVDPQSVEALAFAWLAKRRLHREAGNLPSVTGAARPAILGALHRP